MKITKSQLKRIIKEELEGLLQEEHAWAHTRLVPGELYGASPSPIDPEQEEAATRKCFDAVERPGPGGSDYSLYALKHGKDAAYEKCMEDEMGMEAQDVPGTSAGVFPPVTGDYYRNKQ